MGFFRIFPTFRTRRPQGDVSHLTPHRAREAEYFHARRAGENDETGAAGTRWPTRQGLRPPGSAEHAADAGVPSEQVAGDRTTLDLVGTFVDAQQPQLPVPALHG
jgi:hypothetical protein